MRQLFIIPTANHSSPASPFPNGLFTQTMRRSSRLGLILGGLLVGVIFHASWVPDSRMSMLPWVPAWLGNFADEGPNFRTALPFVPLAWLCFRGLQWKRTRAAMIGAGGISGACLLASEIGQVFVPNRTADWKDLAWGSVGIAIGIALGWMTGKVGEKAEN